MGKNSFIHLRIETDKINEIKKKSQDEDVTVSQFCRQRLSEGSSLQRIEVKLDFLFKELKYLNKLNTGG